MAQVGLPGKDIGLKCWLWGSLALLLLLYVAVFLDESERAPHVCMFVWPLWVTLGTTVFCALRFPRERKRNTLESLRLTGLSMSEIASLFARRPLHWGWLLLAMGAPLYLFPQAADGFGICRDPVSRTCVAAAALRPLLAFGAVSRIDIADVPGEQFLHGAGWRIWTGLLSALCDMIRLSCVAVLTVHATRRSGRIPVALLKGAAVAGFWMAVMTAAELLVALNIVSVVYLRMNGVLEAGAVGLGLLAVAAFFRGVLWNGRQFRWESEGESSPRPSRRTVRWGAAVLGCALLAVSAYRAHQWHRASTLSDETARLTGSQRRALAMAARLPNCARPVSWWSESSYSIAPYPGALDEHLATVVLVGVLRRDPAAHRRLNAAVTLLSLGSGREDVVQALLEALEKDTLATVRNRSAQALGTVAGNRDDVVQALLRALDADKDPGTRACSTWALGEVGAGRVEVMRALLEALDKDDDSGVRRLAATALGRVGGRREFVARGLLEALANEKDYGVRGEIRPFSEGIGPALGKVGAGREDVIQAMLKLAEGDLFGDRWLPGALAKAGKGREDVMRVLVKLLDAHHDSDVREEAAKALGQVGAGREDVVQALLRALEQKKPPGLRWAAAGALGRVGAGREDVVEALLKALLKAMAQKGHYSAPGPAASALGEVGVGREDVVRALLKLLESKWAGHYNRAAAARALGKVGHDRDDVVQALVKTVESDESFAPADIRGHPWPGIGEEAIWSLGELGAGREDAVKALLRALRKRPARLTAAALAKAGAGREDVVRALLKMLEAGEYWDRAAAAEALGEAGGNREDVVGALLASLARDRLGRVRTSAAKALRGELLGREDVVQALLMTLKKDKWWRVRVATVDALPSVRRSREDVTRAMVKALEDDEIFRVRRRAAEALGGPGPLIPEAMPALLKAAKSDKNREVRQAAAEALKKIKAAQEQKR